MNGLLHRQPRSKAEALATARALDNGGWNFSLGKSQFNRYNLAKYGPDYSTVFEPCANLRAGAAIFKECYGRAATKYGAGTPVIQAALSCYYSGNFRRGFIPDKKGQPSYVARVMQAAALKSPTASNEGEALAIPVRATSGATRSVVERPPPGMVLRTHDAERTVVLQRAPPKRNKWNDSSTFDGYAAGEEHEAQMDGYGPQSKPRVSPSKADGRGAQKD